MTSSYVISSDRPSRRDLFRGGPTLITVADPSGAEVLACPRIKRLDRTGRHPLSGDVGDGASLERDSRSRFRLVDGEGGDLARFRHRMALPTRRMRMSWEIEEGAAPTTIVLQDTPFSVPETVRRRSAGEVLATYWSDDGWRLELYPDRGVLTFDRDRSPLSRRTALAAGVVVRALHQEASF